VILSQTSLTDEYGDSGTAFLEYTQGRFQRDLTVAFQYLKRSLLERWGQNF